MKKITLSFTVNQLVVFLVSIPLLLSIYSFVSPKENEDVGGSEITLEQAQSFYQNNKNASYPFGGSIEAVSISSQMLDAMNNLGRNVNASGYRCYFAKNDTGQDVAVIVGTDMMNKDITSSIESATSVSQFAACPPACDASSQVIAGN